MAEDGQKMSKSLGNVVNPDDVINEYGADSLRLYEMFMGPLSQVCTGGPLHAPGPPINATGPVAHDRGMQQRSPAHSAAPREPRD